MAILKIKQFESLSRLGSREIVGVDFTTNHLRIASARVIANRIDKINFASKDIVGASDEVIAKAIKTIFNEQKLFPSTILNVIPSHLVITKNIEMPSRDPREIREIVNLQAGRHTPYSREEIIVDYIEIGTYRNNYTKVLLVIVARHVIKRQFEIFDRAGLKLEKILFAPESIGRFISKIMKSETEDTPASIVHLDEDFTDFIVVHKGKVIYPRSIPIGSEHLIRQKEQYLTRFIDEVKNSLEAYEAEDIEHAPSSIILTGAIEQLPDLQNVLDDALHIPISKLQYLQNLPITQEAQKLAAASSRQSFLNVATSLFTYHETKLALIPEEVRLRRSFEERSKEIIKTGIFVFTALVLICSIFISNIYFQNVYFNKLKAIYDPLAQEAQKLEKDYTRVQAVKSYLSNRGYALDVLSEFYDILPQNVRLSDISYDITGKFSIRGIAKSMSAVFGFVEEMEKSKYFKDVKNRYTTKRKEEGEDVADFEIVCVLERESK